MPTAKRPIIYMLVSVDALREQDRLGGANFAKWRGRYSCETARPPHDIHFRRTTSLPPSCSRQVKEQS